MDSVAQDAFELPLFDKGQLELRFENGVVCIYGTADGLGRLSDLIGSLIEKPNMGHIHLECPSQLKLLTTKSERGAIAIF